MINERNESSVQPNGNSNENYFRGNGHLNRAFTLQQKLVWTRRKIGPDPIIFVKK